MSGNAPRRVLWLNKQMGAGGAERLLVSAAKCHDSSRFAIEAAYLLRWNNQLVPELEAAGVPVTCLDVDSATDLRWVARLARLLRRGRYDIIHAHSALAASVVRPLAKALLLHPRPAVVVTEHAAWPSYHPLTRLAARASARMEAAHIAVSPSVKDNLPAVWRDRTEVIVHGVLLDEIRSASRARDTMRASLGLRDDNIAVVTVANLVAEKAYHDLLAAARIVVDDHPEVRFFAAGHGPLEAELRQLHRELGLGESFQFLGYRPDATAVMSAGDIFALSSVYEGHPVAVMEALTVGLPVVATAVGGVPQAIRDGIEGRVVKPGSPEQLAKAIEELVENPEARAAMATAAATRSTNFDIRTAVEAIERIYTRVLPGG